MGEYRIEVFRSKQPQARHPWYFHIREANGRIIATSEGYFSKFNAFRQAGKLGLPVIDRTAN